MELDLRPDLPTLTHTRDIVATRESSAYWLLYDTKDITQSPDTYGVAVTLGGAVVHREAVPSTTIEKAQVDIGRTVSAGEWHRIRVVHTLPSRDIPPYLDFSLRTAETREVLLTVRFPDSVTPRVTRFERAYSADLAELLASPDTTTVGRPTKSTIDTDAFGDVTTKFSFPEPGFHYGLAWQLPA
jgi:hypothetical protein